MSMSGASLIFLAATENEIRTGLGKLIVTESSYYLSGKLLELHERNLMLSGQRA